MKKIDFVFYAVIAGLAVAAPIIAMQPKAATVTVDPGETLTEGVYDLVPQAPPAPPDTDGDGVPDVDDACPTIPAQTPDGCPLPPPDADNDGVEDAVDQCPGTPEGAPVDATGCEFDTDGDGVVDSIDQCPGTPAGDEVDSVGCTVVPPPPPPPVTGILEAIQAAAPEQHATEIRWQKIAGSEIDVLVGSTEFPYCNRINCFKSYESFTAFVGGAWDFINWRYVNPAGGGHSSVNDNSLYVATLAAENGELVVNWTRPIDPAPPGEPPNCNMLATGPPSSHLYAGAVYVPTRDEVFASLFGGYTMNYAECQETQAAYQARSIGGWTTDGQTYTHVTQQNFGYPRLCYLPQLDRIFNGTDHMIEPSNGYAVTPIQHWGGYWSVAGNFDAAADVANNICYHYLRNVGVVGFQFAADGSRTKVFQSVDPVFNVPSLEVDPQTGHLVVVGVNGYAAWIDKDTGIKTDISAATGMPGPGRLYGKFALIPDLPCTGVGLDDARDGVYLAVLPASVCSMPGQPIVIEPPTEPPVVVEPPTEPPTEPPVVDPPPPTELVEAVIDPGYIPSSTSFENRCAQPGVVFCDPLSDQPSRKIVDGVTTYLPSMAETVGQSWWRKWRGGEQYPEYGGTAIFDSVENALRIFKPDNMPTKGGAFVTHFSDKAGENAFDPGDTFSVEFDVKFDCAMVFADCDPTSPTYKTERIGHITKAGNMQGHKVLILSEGSYAHGFDGYPATACCASQIVVSQNFGAWASFNSQSRAHQIIVRNPQHVYAGGRKNLDNQTGRDYQCYWFPYPLKMREDGKDFKRYDWNYVGPNCAMIEADQWITVRMHVSLAAVGTYDGPNNLFQMFVAYEDEPLKEVSRVDLKLNDPGRYHTHGTAHFTFHSTGSIANSGQPDKIAWYRNLVVKKH